MDSVSSLDELQWQVAKRTLEPENARIFENAPYIHAVYTHQDDGYEVFMHIYDVLDDALDNIDFCDTYNHA